MMDAYSRHYGIHSLVFVGEGWSIKVCKFETRRKKCEQTFSKIW